jgi:hypothetical protein
VSGNPGGRSRALRDLQVAARRCDSEALDALVSVALDPAQGDASARYHRTTPYWGDRRSGRGSRAFGDEPQIPERERG